MEVKEDKPSLYPAVRIDLMRAALTAFELARHKYQRKGKPWSRKAWDALCKVVREDMHNLISYDQRCHGFRNMFKRGVPKALEKWLVPAKDGEGIVLHQVLIDAAALAPLRRDGKFRIKGFRATVEKIVSEKRATTDTISEHEESYMTDSNTQGNQQKPAQPQQTGTTQPARPQPDQFVRTQIPPVKKQS